MFVWCHSSERTKAFWLIFIPQATTECFSWSPRHPQQWAREQSLKGKRAFGLLFEREGTVYMVGITIWSPIWPNVVTGGRARRSPWLDHLQAIGLCWTAWTKRQKDEKTKWQKHQKTKTTFRQADSVERLGPCGWEEEAVANSGECHSAHHYTSWLQPAIIENTCAKRIILTNHLRQETWKCAIPMDLTLVA